MSWDRRSLGTIKPLGGFCLAKGRRVALIKIYFKFMGMGSCTTRNCFPWVSSLLPQTQKKSAPAPLTSSKHERQRWVLFSKDLNSICTFFMKISPGHTDTRTCRWGIIHPFIRDRKGLSTGTTFLFQDSVST